MSWPFALLLSIVFAAGAARAQDFPFPGVGYERGDRDAPITVVEFADFGCPACAEFALGTLPAIHDEYLATGLVRWKLVPFQLGPFRHAKQAAQAAICAGDQSLFWEMHDYLFEDQERWQDPRDPEPTFRSAIAKAGGDTAAFASCYDRKETGTRANRLRSLARRVGVRATPAFIIDGRWALGALSPSQFRRLLEAALRP